MGRRRRLKFRDEYIPLILSGRKRTTIRAKAKYVKGEVVDVADLRGKIHGEAVISNIVEKRFSDLTDQDAIEDGFPDVKELKKALKDIYGDLEEDATLYIYHFKFRKRRPLSRKRRR